MSFRLLLHVETKARMTRRGFGFAILDRKV
jgi:hypothetical protein